MELASQGTSTIWVADCAVTSSLAYNLYTHLREVAVGVMLVRMRIVGTLNPFSWRDDILEFLPSSPSLSFVLLSRRAIMLLT